MHSALPNGCPQNWVVDHAASSPGDTAIDAGNRLNLWPWQIDAVQAWRANSHRGIVQAVTGAGKTRVAYAALRDCLMHRGRTLVIVPTAELMAQWVRGLRALHPDLRVGALSGGQKPKGDEHVIVGIVNSVTSAVSGDFIDQWLAQRIGLLVADECHRYAAPTFSRALDDRFGWRLGLTATLERTDSAEETYLLPYFASVVFNLGYERALADEVVSPWKVVRIGLPLTAPEQGQYRRLEATRRDERDHLARIWGIPTSDPEFFTRVTRAANSGDRTAARTHAIKYMRAFSEQRALTAMSKNKLDALSKTLPVLLGHIPALVFTTTTSSADEAQRVVEASGLRAKAVHSNLAQADRAAAMAAFEEDEIEVLLAPRVLDEGVDVPDCRVAFVIGMGSSARQLKQRLGRIIRRSPSKRWATLFYFYALGTHEDPTGGFAAGQWSEVTRFALEVQELRHEDLQLRRTIATGVLDPGR
ncbi:DEAD/DEAH box helicase [Microbacterium lacticum]